MVLPGLLAVGHRCQGAAVIDMCVGTDADTDGETDTDGEGDGDDELDAEVSVSKKMG